jgi:hypothetical protein
MVWIIESICSTARGSFVFFTTGKKDYSETFPVRRRRKAEGGIKS